MFTSYQLQQYRSNYMCRNGNKWCEEQFSMIFKQMLLVGCVSLYICSLHLISQGYVTMHLCSQCGGLLFLICCRLVAQSLQLGLDFYKLNPAPMIKLLFKLIYSHNFTENTTIGCICYP